MSPQNYAEAIAIVDGFRANANFGSIAKQARAIVDGSSVTAGNIPQPSSDNLGEFTAQYCELLGALRALAVHAPTREAHDAFEALARESAGWLPEYFAAYPDRRKHVSDLIQADYDGVFPWEWVRPKSRGLALLYNFSPFQDTGATVASKRIRDMEVSVDVIACSFLNKKKQDPTIEKIAAPYINRRHFLPLNASWESWDPIRAFAYQASTLATKFMETNGGYEFIYTRAMWVASLYAGALFKFEHPAVEWIAEFSDPLSLDVEGLPRGSKLPDTEAAAWWIEKIEAKVGPIPEEKKTTFGLGEYMVYAYADKIMFTNSNQQLTMLESIENDELRASIQARSIVSNHPTLPSEYYRIESTDYEVDDDKLNLAYFGEFYSSRGITEVSAAMRSLPEPLAEKVVLHVFTNYIPAGDGNRRPRGFSKRQFDLLVQRAHDGIGSQGIEHRIRLNASLPYLKFLATTMKMDYLIVNDARSGEHHEVNPYLPSKWSDYAGSSAKSWGFVEEGSILSTKPVHIKTPRGDAWAARQDLWNMVVAKFPEFEEEFGRHV
ncbi:hypothetical protein [Corynebacterium sp. H130]|uniref:hypothetical protein n=1 Tax=Corynebacterium sp. H130 TaxID=3133444 RepID=UPI0030A0FB16